MKCKYRIDFYKTIIIEHSKIYMRWQIKQSLITIPKDPIHENSMECSAILISRSKILRYASDNVDHALNNQTLDMIMTQNQVLTKYNLNLLSFAYARENKNFVSTVRKKFKRSKMFWKWKCAYQSTLKMI